jgi:hypothetical protein
MARRLQRDPAVAHRQDGAASRFAWSARRLDVQLSGHRRRGQVLPQVVAVRFGQAAIPGGPHQDVDLKTLGRDEIVIDVALAIGDIHQVHVGLVFLQLCGFLQTVEPLAAFLVADGTLFAPVFFAALRRGTLPDQMIGHPQRHLSRRDQQSGMIKETLVRGIAQHAQSRGGGMMGEIKLGGVLDRQHHGLTGHPGFIGLPVGFENFKFVDFVMVKKPIRGLEPVRRPAGQRNGGARVAGEFGADLDQAFGQTRVSQVGPAEFLFYPSCALIRRQVYHDSWRRQ